jgi:hypothetical protein
MKNLFIVTSALNPSFGAIDLQERFDKTLDTIESIRKKDPECLIFLIDGSPRPIEEDKIKILKPKVDYLIYLGNHSTMQELTASRQKSAAEAYLLISALKSLKFSATPPIKRIWKVTGRGTVMDEFDITAFDDDSVKDKYVFKKRVRSWMHPALELVDTRFWSFDYSLIDETIDLLSICFNDCLTSGWDIEHVIFKHINKSKLVEWDRVWFTCALGSTGEIVYD